MNGFGIAHLSFFPNFFSELIPNFYLEVPYEKTLIPDGNLLRNAGNTFSYQLIFAFVLIVAAVISLIYQKQKEL